MAKRLSVVLTAAALVLALVPSVSAAPGRDPFAGVWKATDYDGSSMTLAISGGRTLRILAIYDDGCSGCTPRGSPIYGVGTGTVSGPNLDAEFYMFVGPGVTLNGPPEYYPNFVAQPNGTLLEQDPGCPASLCSYPMYWHRVRL